MMREEKEISCTGFRQLGSVCICGVIIHHILGGVVVYQRNLGDLGDLVSGLGIAYHRDYSSC